MIGQREASAPVSTNDSHQLTELRFREIVRCLVPDYEGLRSARVALVALMDDGELKTVVALGDPEPFVGTRCLWADDTWSALVGQGEGSYATQLLTIAGRTLMPITVNSVLYGAIEWLGYISTDAVAKEGAECALEKLTPVLVRAILE